MSCYLVLGVAEPLAAISSGRYDDPPVQATLYWSYWIVGLALYFRSQIVKTFNL